MKTYRDLYDEWIDQLYEYELDELPSWVTGGRTPSRIMAENDPIMYRCGFSDWFDSETLSGVRCDCGNELDADWITQNCDMDDLVECPVCRGDAFECEECGEIYDTAQRVSVDGEDMCPSCAEDAQMEMDEDDSEEDCHA